MDPQQPTNPVSDDDDVEGHRVSLQMDGAQDEADDVEGHRVTSQLDREQDADDVAGHMTGALGSKTDHER